MLRLMRKHAKAWFMQVLLGIIIIVFIFYFGSMRGRRQAETAAIVKDKAIGYLELRNEYQKLIEYYRQRYKEALTDEVLASLNLKQRALDTLINQAVILVQADKLNLKVSDEEVRSAILSYPAFQRDGVFDTQRYQQMLRYNRMNPEDFETMQHKTMVIEKLENLIKEAIKVSDKEVFDIYRIQNEKIDVNFIKIPTSTCRKQVTPTDDDLRQYLEAHAEDFREPRKVQIQYLAFAGKDHVASSDITEDDIEDYYENHKGEFVKSDNEVYPLAEVKDTVIEKLQFIHGMDRAHEEAKKANDIIYQEENFEKYAKENQLTITTTKFFSERQIPRELSSIEDIQKYLFDMEEGETAPLLADNNGFYILKVGTIKPSYIPELDEVQKRVKTSYIVEESKTRCQKKAEAIFERLRNGEDFHTVAHDEGLKVRETGMFLPGGAVPLIGSSPELAQALFLLSGQDPYPDKPFYVNKSYVVVRFKDRGKLNLDDFESQKEKLRKLLLRFKEEEQFQLWLETTKASMIEDGTLKIMADMNNL